MSSVFNIDETEVYELENDEVISSYFKITFLKFFDIRTWESMHCMHMMIEDVYMFEKNANL